MSGTVEILVLLGSGMAAGAINAVAGGGTLVTFPALLFLGTSPVMANATSTLALVAGTAGSVFGYRRHLAAIQPWLWRFSLVSLLGGLLGGMLLTRTNDQTFSKLVPFLILFATVLFLGQGLVGRMAISDRAVDGPSGRRRIYLAISFQFLVAIYGGYFGAGIGILMLASLGFLGLGDIHEMNALKNFFGMCINAVAAAYFILRGAVAWPAALVMVGGAIAG